MATNVQVSKKSGKTVSRQGARVPAVKAVKPTTDFASSYAEPKIAVTDIILTGNIRPLDPDKVTQYANSIKKTGLIDRVTVEKVGEKYQIISGHHRVAAMKQLGWVNIPVQFMLEKRGSQAALVANIARHDMPPMQIARNFKAYCEVDDVIDESKVKDLAQQLGRSVSYVKDYLKMNNMIGEFQNLAEKLESGFTQTHAAALMSGDKANQRDTFKLWQKFPGVVTSETLKTWVKNPAKADAALQGKVFVEPKRPGMESKPTTEVKSVSQAFHDEVKRLTQGKATETEPKYAVETVDAAAKSLIPLVELVCMRLADGIELEKIIASLTESVKE